MKKDNSELAKSVIKLTAAELCVSAVVVGIYLIIGKFDWKVLTGAALGVAVTVAYFWFLLFAAGRAVDKVIDERGTSEMTEEEAAEFTKEHEKSVKNTMQASYIIRMVGLAVVLGLALLSGWFNPIATLVPLCVFRPLITVYELFIKKK